MFAVVSSDDRMPVFVKEGYVGFWPCEPDNILGWALLHSKQGEVVTEAALRGSMVGWDNPAARAAIQMGSPVPARGDSSSAGCFVRLNATIIENQCFGRQVLSSLPALLLRIEAY